MQLFASANGPIYNVYILMDIRRAHKIINDYSIAFFDR
jgi:hypothetical protein